MKHNPTFIKQFEELLIKRNGSVFGPLTEKPTPQSVLRKKLFGMPVYAPQDDHVNVTVRMDYFNSILDQLYALREEVERLRPSIKDYKIDAAAWNAEREVSRPRKHWIDTVDYRKRDPWGSI